MSSNPQDFLTAVQIAKIMYRLKYSVLTHCNASNALQTIKQELDESKLDCELNDCEETQQLFEEKSKAYEAAKAAKLELGTPSFEQQLERATNLQASNTLFQYLLDEYMRPAQRLNQPENSEAIFHYVIERNSDKTLIIEWPNIMDGEVTLQAVSKEKFVSVPPDIIFERKGGRYKRADTNIWKEGDQLVMPNEQIKKRHFSAEKISPVIWPQR
jgi:hypothetical protein